MTPLQAPPRLADARHVSYAVWNWPGLQRGVARSVSDPARRATLCCARPTVQSTQHTGVDIDAVDKAQPLQEDLRHSHNKKRGAAGRTACPAWSRTPPARPASPAPPPRPGCAPPSTACASQGLQTVIIGYGTTAPAITAWPRSTQVTPLQRPMQRPMRAACAPRHAPLGAALLRQDRRARQRLDRHALQRQGQSLLRRLCTRDGHGVLRHRQEAASGRGAHFRKSSWPCVVAPSDTHSHWSVYACMVA